MILIIGSNGQLGLQMQKTLKSRDQAFCNYDYPVVDLAQPDSVRKIIALSNPSTIINCAAYTNVDQAETDYESAYNINALGTKYLAEICNEKEIELIHISTDYVFSGVPIIENGKPRGYIETDPCNPATVYGKTKLQGEKFLQDAHDKWYLLRTAWLYGDGNNFVRTMLKLAQNYDTVRVVMDQIGSPTSTVDLANAICMLIGTGDYGLYHATCEGSCSWYDFARKIFELKKTGTVTVPVTSEEFIRPAARPKWSVLENARFNSSGLNVFRTWEDALEEYLNNN